MASPDLVSSLPSSTSETETFYGSFNIAIEETKPANFIPALEVSTSSGCNNINININIPKPPPLPCKTWTKNSHPKRLASSSHVPAETRDTWDKLFKDGYGADVRIITEDGPIIQAHSCVLVGKKSKFLVIAYKHFFFFRL